MLHVLAYIRGQRSPVRFGSPLGAPNRLSISQTACREISILLPISSRVAPSSTVQGQRRRVRDRWCAPWREVYPLISLDEVLYPQLRLSTLWKGGTFLPRTRSGPEQSCTLSRCARSADLEEVPEGGPRKHPTFALRDPLRLDPHPRHRRGVRTRLPLGELLPPATKKSPSACEPGKVSDSNPYLSRRLPTAKGARGRWNPTGRRDMPPPEPRQLPPAGCPRQSGEIAPDASQVLPPAPEGLELTCRKLLI